MAEQTLGQMVIKLSLDSSAFGSGLDAAKKASKNAMMEMKADMAIAAAAGDKVGVLQAKQAGLMKEMQSKVNEMKKAQDAYNASFTNTGEAQASTAKYAKDFNKAAMELARFQKQIVQAAGQQAVLEVKTKGVTGAINKMGAGLTTGGKALSNFGSKATMGVTVPIVAAFAAATKKAMAFQNQLIVIKNLLTTSGESGASAMKAVNQMQEQAVQLSNHYGVSVEKITEGYEALVRRGYNGAQAVGAMKAELQGALASGDDFNDVVKVASETIEAFGLRTDKAGHQIQSTSKMAAITKKTVNELAYAADMTATDFQGIGYSMSYVGATAKQAGYSVSSTAAALGILSNNGLSSQKAGTGLRKVLISLTTAAGKIDSKNSVLKKLGITKDEIMDSQGNLKSLSEIMNVLNQHTASMSSTKKGVVFNSLFGTTGQQAGLILANNSAELAKLNTQIEKSSKTNYVGQLSEKNLASAQNQLRVFKETLSNLGMVLAKDVLPTITPIMGDVKDMADRFSKLDPKMRKNILTWLAIAAAVGPFNKVIGIAGQMLGKTSTGMVSMIANVAKWRKEAAMANVVNQATNAGLSGMQVAAQGTETALEASGQSATRTASFWGTLKQALTKATPEATAAGTAISGTGTAMGATVESGVALTGALSAIGLGLGALGVTLAASTVYWELWGKAQYQSQQRSKEWGSDIGQTADTAADKFRGFETDATTALENTNSSAKVNGKAIEEAFGGMATAAKKSAKAQSDAAAKIAKELGGDAGAAIMNEQDKQDAKSSKAISKMQSYYSQVEAITKEARDKNVALTADQKQQIHNLQLAMAEQSVKTLNISATQQKQVLKVLNGDTQSLSTATLKTLSAAEDAQVRSSKKTLDQKLKVAKDAYKKGTINAAQYNAARKALNSEFEAETQSNLIAELKMNLEYAEKNKKAGQTNAQVKKEQMALERTYLTETLGLSKTQADAIMDLAYKQEKAASTTAVNLDKLTGKVKKAGQEWNGMVLDPKTGKVKTNAVEEVAKGLSSAKTWNNLQLLMKEGKMTTNAKQVAGEAIIQAKRWNELSFDQKEMLAVSKTNDALMKSMADAGVWDNLTPKTQMLIATSKTTAGLTAALKDMGVWDSLTPKQKDMIAHAKTSADVKKALQDVGAWNGLPSKVKDLIAHDYASGNARAALKALKDFNNFNNNIVKNIWVNYHETGKAGAARAAEARANSWYKKKGTNDFQGGPAIVNDQQSPTFRELVIDPRLGAFVPEGQNVFIPHLSKHAKVIPAHKTAQMFPGLPQFADGLNVPLNATPLAMARDLENTVNARAARTISVNNDNASTDNRIDVVITLLQGLLDKDQDVYMDKVKVGREIYPEIKKAQARDTRITNRRGGLV